MLIIRRRQGESILIGGDIEIEIVEMGPGRVKVGINAPRHIAVQRKEVAAVRERNLVAGTLAVDVRAWIAQCVCPENNTQTFPAHSDKAFEARYTGHPETKENPGPA